MRFFCGDVKRGQELLVLVVQVCPLPAEGLDDWLPLRERRPGSAVQRRVLAERVTKINYFRRVSFLDFLRITLAASFEQGVTWGEQIEGKTLHLCTGVLGCLDRWVVSHSVLNISHWPWVWASVKMSSLAGPSTSTFSWCYCVYLIWY